MEENTAEVMRRDTLGKETVSLDGIVDYVANLLEDIQNNIYTKARTFHDSLKSIAKLRTALPAAIEWLRDEGYDFRTL